MRLTPKQRMVLSHMRNRWRLLWPKPTVFASVFGEVTLGLWLTGEEPIRLQERTLSSLEKKGLISCTHASERMMEWKLTGQAGATP